MHREVSLRIARPLLARAIDIQLDAVAVRVAEIEGFADAMIAGAVEGNAGVDEPAQRIGQRGTGRIEDGDVIQPGRSRRRGLAPGAFPCIEADVMVVPARGEEGGPA